MAPFYGTYEPMKDDAILSAATGFTSTTGRKYIIVFHECFYMPKLSHTLIKPNQLRQFQTQVQENPYATDSMSITSSDGNLISCLESEGTNIFLNTWSPTKEDLASLPHIELTFQQPWEPHNISFPATKYYVKEEMESQIISSLSMNFRKSLKDPVDTPVVDAEDVIFDTQELNRRIVDSVRVSETQENYIEGSTIDKQRRVAELVTNKRIEEMIHNEKQNKDVKDLHPAQMAEFAVDNSISELKAFSWWLKYVLKKQDQIISKTQRFWIKTHNYGIRVPITVKEEIDTDKENGDTLWWDAIMKEMKNARPTL